MARKRLEINKVTLLNCVMEAEKDGPLKNESELFQTVSALYEQRTGQAVHWGVVRLRLSEWSVSYKTEKGKRGRAKLSSEQKTAMQDGRTSRAEKLLKFSDSYELMYKRFPKRFHPVIDKAKAGSTMAHVKLECLDCQGCQTNEIKNCPVKHCGLYPIRPYK